jgi:hypothetical protein
MVESRPEVAEDFRRQEIEAQEASGFYHYVPKNSKKVRFETHVRDRDDRENHAAIPYSVKENIVRVLTDDQVLIGHATLRGKNLCAFPKHYFDNHQPGVIHAHGKYFKVTGWKFDDPEAKDCWCFAEFDGPGVKYRKMEMKVPTKRATGALCGLGGFQPIAIDLNPQNRDITYIGESNYTDCGFTVIDSEKVNVIGLHAGIYKNSGNAYALPVTEDTILCEQSFL